MENGSFWHADLNQGMLNPVLLCILQQMCRNGFGDMRRLYGSKIHLKNKKSLSKFTKLKL